MWLQVLHTLDQVAGAPLHENGRPDGWDEDLKIGLQAHEINLDFIRNGPPAAADEDEDAYGPPPPPPPPPTPAPTMAPTPPNFAAFAENLLTTYNGDQQAAHTAFAALLGALDLVDNTTPTTPDEAEAEEPKPEPEPEPTVPDPPARARRRHRHLHRVYQEFEEEAVPEPTEEESDERTVRPSPAKP